MDAICALRNVRFLHMIGMHFSHWHLPWAVWWEHEEVQSCTACPCSLCTFASRDSGELTAAGRNCNVLTVPAVPRLTHTTQGAGERCCFHLSWFPTTQIWQKIYFLQAKFYLSIIWILPYIWGLSLLRKVNEIQVKYQVHQFLQNLRIFLPNEIRMGLKFTEMYVLHLSLGVFLR